ncbi:MAG: DUF3090 domain-containing protein [Chloroflexota bacterium]|nr:DUF3090 domain-containing protein [Chloroflexota bacterium]
MADDPFGALYGRDAQRVRAEALGEPGQRRFRLLVLVDGATYIGWMEKQQLQALGLALDQLLEHLPDTGPELDLADSPLPFDGDTRLQFRIGRMELGYDERGDRIVVIGHELEKDDEEQSPSLACRLTRGQVRALIEEAAAVAAAGRPRCTMCGAPMSAERHTCPQQNGHLPLVYDETDDAHELG